MNTDHEEKYKNNRKIIIGDNFPVLNVKVKENFCADDISKILIVLCLLAAFMILGIGGAVFSIWSGDVTIFQVIWNAVQTFIGILVGYFFGRNGLGSRNEKDNDESPA
jgi:hypothetical protein